MPSPYSIPPHAYPPPYSIPAHAYPPLYSIPAHAYPPPILSQPMPTLLLFYPSLYTPSPLFYLTPYMHALHLFSPTVCMSSPVLYQPHMPPQYFIPAHACPPNSLSHEPGRHVSLLTSENAAFRI